MTFGSVFAGIGGMDLGLERAGMECRWQVEIDPFCRRVLAKHWPDVRRHDDVRTFPPDDSESWRVDLIAGGFPCQDVSNAGNKQGLSGERSGLWREYHRILRHLRPRYVLIENVAALVVRGLDRVLADLASLGFDAEWSVLSACAMGAPHARERLFLVAHRNGERWGCSGYCPERRHEVPAGCDHWQAAPRGQTWAYVERWLKSIVSTGDGATDAGDVCGVAHGVSRELDSRRRRLKACGNAVVPQVAEWIGRRIIEANQQEEDTA
jgi:DNA (cytosine-5)-methyltransferase 1